MSRSDRPKGSDNNLRSCIHTAQRSLAFWKHNGNLVMAGHCDAMIARCQVELQLRREEKEARKLESTEGE